VFLDCDRSHRFFLVQPTALYRAAAAEAVAAARICYGTAMSKRIARIGRAAAGLGLFAVKPIKKRAYIVSYRGKWIPTAEAQRRERRSGAKYMFEVNRRWTIDGSARSNLGRYLNHSCRPNAVAVLRGRIMAIVALRDIAPGEEITYDYGEEYFTLFIAPAGCHCAACASRAKAGTAPRRRAA
jgi:hypothetical protein